MKEDQAREADIKRLNRMLFGSIVHLKDIVIQTRLMLAVIDALDKLESNEVLSN